MNKSKKAVIFGTGVLSELASFYLEHDSSYTVHGFCVTDPTENSYLGKPLVDFEKVTKHFPPDEYEMFVAVGYRLMNELRKKFCEEARIKGYTLLSYISSKAIFWNKENSMGDNVFVFEDNTIQPFVTISSGVILWSGNHIGHHSVIEEYAFISSHCVISGFCHIGKQCFLGVNSTIIDHVHLGDKILVGAGALVTKSLEKSSVFLQQKGVLLEKTSDYFLK